MHSRILILDTESFFAEMLREALLEQFTGCLVVVETSDVTGLEKIIHEHFRCVIISLELFEMLDDNIISELKSLFDDLAVILNLPTMDLRRIRRARRQGIQAFISRNSDVQEIVQTLQSTARAGSPAMSGQAHSSSPLFEMGQTQHRLNENGRPAAGLPA